MNDLNNKPVEEEKKEDGLSDEKFIIIIKAFINMFILVEWGYWLNQMNQPDRPLFVVICFMLMSFVLGLRIADKRKD